MQNILRFIAVTFLAAAILWGCTPLAATLNAVRQPIADPTAGALAQTPSVPATVDLTEIIEYAPAMPERSRAGSCAANSARVPRTNVWQCTIDDTTYDPCFTVGAEEVIICSDDPFDRAASFRVDLTAPLPMHSVAAIAGALNLDALNDLWYFGVDAVDGAVVLENGEFILPKVAQNSSNLAASDIVVRLSEQKTEGDLDQDGDNDAVAVLIASASDIFSRYYLATISNENGTPVNSATIALGDGIRVDNLAIEYGQIVIDMTTHGTQDPICCPARAETRFYNLKGNQLEMYVNSWQVELSDGILCSLPSKSNNPNGYRCNDGSTLWGSLQPGAVWTGQQPRIGSAAPPSAAEISTVAIRRIWQ